MMKRQSLKGRVEGLLLSLLLIALVVIALVTFGGRFWWLPPLASQHGKAIDTLFTVTLVITGIVFVLVQSLLASSSFGLLAARRGEQSTSPRTKPLSWSGRLSQR